MTKNKKALQGVETLKQGKEINLYKAKVMIIESKVKSLDQEENKIFLQDAPLLVVLGGILATIFMAISGFTEYIGLSIALSDMLGTKGNIAALVIAVSIEFGILGLVTYIVNGLYNNYLTDTKFTKKQRLANKIKFVQMFLLLFALLAISIFLSKNNSRMALRANPVKANVESTKHLDSNLKEQIAAIEKRYKEDKKAIKELRSNSKDAINSSYSSKSDIEQQSLNVLERKETRTKKRYTTKKLSIKKGIAQFKAAAAGELSKLDNKYSLQLDDLRKRRDQDIDAIKNDIAIQKNPILNRNARIIDNNTDYAEQLATFISSYAAAASIFFVLIWSWVCLSLNTCGIKPRLFISKEYFETSLFKEFFTLAITSVSRPARNWIRKHLNSIAPLTKLEGNALLQVNEVNNIPLLVPKNNTFAFDEYSKNGGSFSKNMDVENKTYSATYPAPVLPAKEAPTVDKTDIGHNTSKKGKIKSKTGKNGLNKLGNIPAIKEVQKLSDRSKRKSTEMKRKKVLQFYKRYVKKHGRKPTYSIIGEGIGINSTKTVGKYVNFWKQKGEIK